MENAQSRASRSEYRQKLQNGNRLPTLYSELLRNSRRANTFSFQNCYECAGKPSSGILRSPNRGSRSSSAPLRTATARRRAPVCPGQACAFPPERYRTSGHIKVALDSGFEFYPSACGRRSTPKQNRRTWRESPQPKEDASTNVPTSACPSLLPENRPVSLRRTARLPATPGRSSGSARVASSPPVTGTGAPRARPSHGAASATPWPG